jgi:hypothetical protein
MQRNSKADALILEAYTQVRLNENVDAERQEALNLVGQIVRHINTTHPDQWPEELFIQLRDTLNRIKFHENHPTAAPTPPPEGGQPTA